MVTISTSVSALLVERFLSSIVRTPSAVKKYLKNQRKSARGIRKICCCRYSFSKYSSKKIPLQKEISLRRRCECFKIFFKKALCLVSEFRPLKRNICLVLLWRWRLWLAFPHKLCAIL